MLEETVKSIVKSEATRIKDRLSGGMLYGRPIDMTDSDEVLFAACLMVHMEENGSYREWDMLTEIRMKALGLTP